MIERVRQFEVEVEGARQSTEFGEKETENLAPTRSENSTNASSSVIYYVRIFRFQAGQSKRSGRHVSFNDRSGGGGISRGGIHKRLRGGPTGGGALRKFAGSLDDDDASMRPSGSQAGRARPAYGAGRGGRGPRRGMRGGRGGGGLSGGVFVRRNDASDWQKVTLLNASRYPKEEVLTALVGAHAAVAPLCFSKTGMNYVFYVETRQQANALSALDKQIRLQDGSALNIR